MQHDAEADFMERLLIEWGQWRTAGGCGDGFPSMSVIHPNWQPPSPGTTPTLKVSRRSDALLKRVDTAVLDLSLKLQDTLAVRYCRRMSVLEQARLLECSEAAVHERVRRAKRVLVSVLTHR